MVIEIKKGERIMTFHALLVSAKKADVITVYKEFDGITFSATMTVEEWRAQKSPNLLLSIVSEIRSGYNEIKVVLERKRF